MKAQELRISNIVKEGEIMECSNLMARIRKSPSDYGLFTINKLHPLEITPELLEKAGFEKGESIRHYFKSNIWYYFKSNIWYIIEYKRLDIDNIKVPNVIHFHHLQNLIFDLTGKEIGI